RPDGRCDAFDFATVARHIRHGATERGSIAGEHGLPLEALADEAKEAEKLLVQAEQSAAFDALQARRDAESAERRVHALQARVREAEQDVQTLQRMKERLQQREAQLRTILTEQAAQGDTGDESADAV